MKRTALGLLFTSATAYAAPPPDDVVATTVEAPDRDPVANKPVEIVTPIVDTPRPRPDKASGVSQDDATPTSTKLLWIPRSILYLPKMAFWIAVQPVRGAAWATEHYDLANRVEDLAYTDDRRYGLYPTASYESTYGPTIGARAIAQDLFGEGERVKLRADYGGQFRYAVGGKIGTGRRFGRLEITNDTNLERRSRERFYGLGDGPDLDAPPPMPIDPTVDNGSFPTRFGEDLFSNKLALKIKLVDGLGLRTTGAYVRREFTPGDDDPIDEVYQTDKLAGFDTGVRNIYVEQEILYDTRRPASPYATSTIDGTGWWIEGHAGIARGVDNDPTKYFRYGGEIQRYFDLYEGTRTLMLRGLLDAVAGTDGRTDDQIAFVELPELGGPEYLRGFPSGRFRDRATVLTTAEYSWQLSNHFTAYTFVDVGRAISTFDELEPQLLRYGYGGGIQVHSKNTFYLRSQFAVSDDGDFLLSLIFSPVNGRRERAGRF